MRRASEALSGRKTKRTFVTVDDRNTAATSTVPGVCLYVQGPPEGNGMTADAGEASFGCAQQAVLANARQNASMANLR